MGSVEQLMQVIGEGISALTPLNLGGLIANNITTPRTTVPGSRSTSLILSSTLMDHCSHRSRPRLRIQLMPTISHMGLMLCRSERILSTLLPISRPSRYPNTAWPQYRSHRLGR